MSRSWTAGAAPSKGATARVPGTPPRNDETRQVELYGIYYIMGLPVSFLQQRYDTYWDMKFGSYSKGARTSVAKRLFGRSLARTRPVAPAGAGDLDALAGALVPAARRDDAPTFTPVEAF